MDFKRAQFIFLIGMFTIAFSCTNQDLKFEKESKLKLEKVLKLAENKIKVIGQSSSGIDLENKDFDSLLAKVIKTLSLSAYESRTAYLLSEGCLEEKRLNIDRTNGYSNNPDWQKQSQDSVYYSVLKQAIIQIDSIASFRNSDPTIQDLLIEIEKLKALKVEMDKFCK